MNITKVHILLPLALLPIIFVVITLDLIGFFNYGDLPFLVGFTLYVLFVVTEHSGSRMTLCIALFLLLWMGLSYIPTGAGKVTERVGEWFYLFFVFGLVQYLRDAYA